MVLIWIKTLKNKWKKTKITSVDSSLEKEIVNRRIHRLKKSGINFYTNYEIGNTISFEEFKNRHDAVLIATGVYKPKEINLNNSKASNVVAALDFLIASNR